MKQYFKTAAALCLSILIFSPATAQEKKVNGKISEMMIKRTEKHLNLQGDSAAKFEKTYLAYMSEMRALRHKHQCLDLANEFSGKSKMLGINDNEFNRRLELVKKQTATTEDIKWLKDFIKEKAKNLPEADVQRICRDYSNRPAMKEQNNGNRQKNGRSNLLRNWKMADQRSEEEISKKIQADFEYSQKVLDLRKKYFENFKKVLKPSQIEKLYNQERNMGQQFRKEQQRRQQGMRPNAQKGKKGNHQQKGGGMNKSQRPMNKNR